MEPMYEKEINEFLPSNTTASGPMYLVKEDNVTSEQTFLVTIQVSDTVPPGEILNPATLDVDYNILDVVSVTFPAMLQKIPFRFVLLPDSLPEGTEAFLAHSSCQCDGVAEIDGVVYYDVPTFLPPLNLFQETFVFIEDDDRKIVHTANKYYYDSTLACI